MLTRIKNYFQNANYKERAETALMRLAGSLASVYLKIVIRTGAWRYDVHPEADLRMKDQLPSIFLFWHGRLFMMPVAKPRALRVEMLMSINKIGVLTQALVKDFNIGSVRGSARNPKKPEKNKGGVRALIMMIKVLRSGVSVGFTPDGPRGPRMRMTDGAIISAKLSGSPLIPVTFGVKRAFIINSWDRFTVPFPFTKGVIKIGKPIFVEPDAQEEELEKIRVMTENLMNEMTKDADDEIGAKRVFPE